ncbi:TPA: IS5/IS1182 family transposase, partial [Burkholderia cepacia]|nr:IS5/IS1182 family transposase [Burkholderia cepacia]
DQIPTDERLDTVGGDGAYDSKPCHAEIAARGATPSIPPRDGAVHWKTTVRGAAWRNEAVDTIARLGRQEWKKSCGYHRRSLAENAMYRFKTLTGPCLWARRIDSQATEVAIRVGVLNRMTELARPQSVRIA